MERERKIEALLRQMGADLVGFGDVRGLAPDGFSHAVVAAMALPLSVIGQIPSGPTEHYMNIYNAYNARLDEMGVAVEKLLTEEGFRTRAQIRENVSWNRETMATVFPHKTAATRSGLGWVGKCALLVTEEYGGAIRMVSILTDAPLKTAESISESRCGGCEKCVQICPGKAIVGNNWYAGIEREKLVDIPACDTAARDIAEKTLGYRTTMCGRCFAVCPYTQRYVRRVRSGELTENPKHPKDE